MSTVLEYSYDYDDVRPLEGKEAIEHYQREKAAHPDALVTIDDLGCGVHWTVRSYKTDKEKEAYLRKRVERILEGFTKGITRFKR